MREVLIRDVLPGMVLSRPARDLMGNSLLEAGTVLTADHLRTLRAWGVRRINIDPDAGEGSAPAAADRETQERHEEQNRRRRKSTRVFRREAMESGDAPRHTRKPNAASTPAAPVPPATTAERLREMEHMFAPHAGDALMMRIRAIAEQQLRRHAKRIEP